MAKKRKEGEIKKGAEIPTGLSHILADTGVLYFKTLNFHWNMVGPEFYMYHRLLEEQYKELAEALDDLAERIRMLGFPAPGSMSAFLQLACMNESLENLSQEEMVRELVESHESMVEHCRELIKASDALSDQGTSDLLIERLRLHDKNAWLLRSHLERSRKK
jgi:starvation-inducible DNA-binding protein